jgi:glycosyltransferase involved in cell wall biosynthesis
MKILIFSWRDIRNPLAGGAEIVTHELAKRWVAAGHPVTVFSSRPKELPAEEKIDGVTYFRRGNQYTCLGWAWWEYQRQFKGKFDIIIDQVHGWPFFAGLYAKEAVVAFPHEVAKEIWDYQFPFPVNLVGRFLEKVYLWLYKSTPFITVSESAKKDLGQAGITKVEVVIHGLTVPCLSRPPAKFSQPTIVSLSRLVPMKRLEDTIKAVALAKSDLASLRLIVIGKGNQSYRYKLEKLINQLGLQKTVRFYGFVSQTQKIKLLQKSWLLVSTSVREGWGMNITEAAACFTPTLSYNVPGLRDSIVNGRTGILCSDNTPQALAKEMVRLLGDRRYLKRLSKQANSRCRKLDWDFSSQTLYKFLQQSIKNKTGIK